MGNETIVNPLRYLIYIPLALYLGGLVSGFFSPLLWSIFEDYTASVEPSSFTDFLYYSYQASKYLLAGLTYALVVSVVVPKVHKAGFYVAVLVLAVTTYLVHVGIDVLSGGVLAIKAQKIGNISSFLVTSAILLLVMKYTVKSSMNEYESTSEMVEELGEEQEQEELDTVIDNLEEKQQDIPEPEAEALVEEKLDTFKINDSENGCLSPDVLQINGGSYVDGMPDYEWFFSVASENFPALYSALTGETELPDDVADGLKQYLQENGTTVTQLKEVCEANDIECGFTNYM